jgi:hypothetical protein
MQHEAGIDEFVHHSQIFNWDRRAQDFEALFHDTNEVFDSNTQLARPEAGCSLNTTRIIFRAVANNTGCH